VNHISSEEILLFLCEKTFLWF